MGATLIGLVIVVMTWLSEWAGETYKDLSSQCLRFSFAISLIGFGITAWLTFRFFPGSTSADRPYTSAHRLGKRSDAAVKPPRDGFYGVPRDRHTPGPKHSKNAQTGNCCNLAHCFPIAPASVMVLLTITAYFSGML